MFSFLLIFTHSDQGAGMNLLHLPDSLIKQEPKSPSYNVFGNTPSPQRLSPSPIFNPQAPYNMTPNLNVPFNSNLPQTFPQYFQSYQPSMTIQNIASTASPLQYPDTIQHQDPQMLIQNAMIPSTSADARLFNNLSETKFSNSNINLPANNERPIESENMDVNTANLSSLLDMDSHQFTQINSAELSGLSLSLLDASYPTSAVTTVSSRTTTVTTTTGTANGGDGGADDEEENMTDSFTRFANDTIKELNELNTLYQRNEQ